MDNGEYSELSDDGESEEDQHDLERIELKTPVNVFASTVDYSNMVINRVQ